MTLEHGTDRLPRNVGNKLPPLTKYKVDTLKSKHSYILYIANDGKTANYMFRPLKKGHLQVVHLTFSEMY
jgi:hypothetical protein